MNFRYPEWKVRSKTDNSNSEFSSQILYGFLVTNKLQYIFSVVCFIVYTCIK